ncbi:putative FAD-dependent isoamyl alcohol oxidase [Podospora appendiculata]|uniref:FAD-dependent isoamyl alcohol oxidase n=1 Tax=Podospora appendiculata TaxID=314037 RepID=A0AAE0XB14_9PEZI|nr:putative FAD-dependent isoamyl alcohol oxidase [Podospora appendiculata]
MPDLLIQALTAFGAVFFLGGRVDAAAVASCRNIPGDPGWPSLADWAQLNKTVHGQLIGTVPQASVCHTGPYSDYDETACQALRDGWDLAGTIEPHPAGVMNGYYQNQSCDPFTSTSQPCVLGNYAVYSINVTGADDVVAGIKFAKEKNIRLVVKTTGHDYKGQSTGKGALALWMWNLKTADIITNYKSAGYSGPAIKLGSGTIGGEALTVARDAGYRLVSGECGSVGVASGYTQGGGHSMLNSAYGMAADQVLEWEVVTATGEHLTATPTQNTDLYWALCGGGGGTYSVVLSMISKIYPDGPVAGGTLAFQNTDPTAYWEAVSLWIQHAPTLVRQNNTIIYLIFNNFFEALAITLPGQPVSAVSDLLAPYLTQLARLNITHSLTTTHSPTYHDHFNTYFGPLPYGASSPTTILHNHIIPRSITSSPNATANLVTAYRETVKDNKFLIGCLVFDVSNTTRHPPNAVLPAWRGSSTSCNVNAFWNFSVPLRENLDRKRDLVERVVPAIERATPGGAVYLNEMDPWYRGEWKRMLFGGNYERLARVKRRYDPLGVFWGNFSVGSDAFEIDGAGRLCAVAGKGRC